MLEVWCVQKGNAAGVLAQSISSNGADLPLALPWVEPSINNLWLEACRSHLYGNYQAAIITTSVVLELALRMVLANLKDVPIIRDEYEDLFKRETLMPVINAAKSGGILSGKSKIWWKAYCEHIRNKICHGDLLHILDDCREVSQFAGYYDSVDSRENTQSWTYDYIITHPAAFHHKAGRRFSGSFLRDAHKELTSLLEKTEWSEYDEWWKSQKDIYDSFFEFRWSYSTLKRGILSARKSFGSSSK